MALPGQSSLKQDIKDLKPANSAMQGCMAFASVIGKYMSNIQAGSTGTPGIITFNTALFGSLLAAIPPDGVGPPSALATANAWLTAVMASPITPGTVIDSSWTASVVDILTLPIGAASIPTASLGMAKLAKGLIDAQDNKDAPAKIAKAYHEAIGELQFMCMGLMLVGPVPTPLPSLFKAQ